MEVVVFDIWAPFGHFKKFYTTASPLSFSIPTPTALYGLAAAVVGYEKEEYLKTFNASTITFGVQILTPVRKIRLGINAIDTKNSNSFHLIKNRTQIKSEFLVRPKYRIFLVGKEQRVIAQRLQAKSPHFSLSLGSANMLANFAYVGTFEAKEKKAQRVDTAIATKKIKSFLPQPGAHYLKEVLPLDMAPDRSIKAYEEVIFERRGAPLFGAFEEVYEVDGTNVAFFTSPQALA